MDNNNQICNNNCSLFSPGGPYTRLADRIFTLNDTETVKHVYNTGTFQMSLTATNSGGTDITGAIISS